MSSLLRCCRCHPSIAAISNHSFSGGRLLDGCTAADRAPLLPGLPPVLCVDPRGSQPVPRRQWQRLQPGGGAGGRAGEG